MTISSAFHIELRSEAPKYRLSLPVYQKRTAAILKQLGLTKAELSLLFTTDPKIRVINRRHLNHDWATDVISFPQIKVTRHKVTKSPANSYLGDIVISLDTAKRQAKEYGNSFDYELTFYICHGILHLMGFDDHRRREFEEMDKLQKKILKKIGVESQD